MPVVEIAPALRVAPESARVAIGRFEIVFSQPRCLYDNATDCGDFVAGQHAAYGFAGSCELLLDGKPIPGVESVELVVNAGDFITMRVRSASALTVSEIPRDAAVILEDR
ncbi:MAG: hypothetical protein JWN27_2903 [Candidatus Eremiobacteraeota bacterium]|nr:hypothetical protein [Candidatus Eremiobacteraeota bacterium]